MTSHAAVVPAAWASAAWPAPATSWSIRPGAVSVGNRIVRKDDYISLDGSTARSILGEVPTVQPSLSGDFATFMGLGGPDSQAERAGQRRYPS
jgi:pyruvate,orthophosphate dikinase